MLTTDEARRVYAAAGRLEYPARHFIRLLMLTGARRAEIAGLRWDEIVTEDDGSKASSFRQERTKTGAPITSRCRSEALSVIDECYRRRIVGSQYVLTSDGHRSFANFNRVKEWLDEALERGAIADWRLHDFRTDDRLDLGRASRSAYSPVTLDLLLGHQPTIPDPGGAESISGEQHHRRPTRGAWRRGGSI